MMNLVAAIRGFFRRRGPMDHEHPATPAEFARCHRGGALRIAAPPGTTGPPDIRAGDRVLVGSGGSWSFMPVESVMPLGPSGALVALGTPEASHHAGPLHAAD